VKARDCGLQNANHSPMTSQTISDNLQSSAMQRVN